MARETKRSLFVLVGISYLSSVLICCHESDTYCGDNVCDRETENGWCPDCCGLTCSSDGICEAADPDYSLDCRGHYGDCGDGRCVSEEVGRCELDCGICGDGICLPHEEGYCQADCSFNMCGDGRCEAMEENWCRADCYHETGCGNSTCELHEEIYCLLDCLDGICGDGHCSGQERFWCMLDCGQVCHDPSRPINCGDGCWPEDTDCASPIFQCGSAEWRCSNYQHTANCCGGRFYQCLSDTPYYCPALEGCVASLNDCSKDADRRCPSELAYFCALDGVCYATMEECTPTNTVCTFLGLPCIN